MSDAGVGLGKFGDVLVSLVDLMFGKLSQDMGAVFGIGHDQFLSAIWSSGAHADTAV